jgi:hypothetical protein
MIKVLLLLLSASYGGTAGKAWGVMCQEQVVMLRGTL